MDYDKDVIEATAKALWSRRPGNGVMPWDMLTPAGQQILIDDAKFIIATYKTALAILENSERIAASDYARRIGGEV